MGCCNSPEIIDDKEINANSLLNRNNKYDNSETEEDLMSILYLKISNLIINNPFYEISLSNFESTINTLNNKRIFRYKNNN